MGGLRCRYRHRFGVDPPESPYYNALPALIARQRALEAALRGLLEASDPADWQEHTNWSIGPGGGFTEARKQARAALAQEQEARDE